MKYLKLLIASLLSVMFFFAALYGSINFEKDNNWEFLFIPSFILALVAVFNDS